jgi:hypothetical protein
LQFRLLDNSTSLDDAITMAIGQDFNGETHTLRIRIIAIVDRMVIDQDMEMATSTNEAPDMVSDPIEELVGAR